MTYHLLPCEESVPDSFHSARSGASLIDGGALRMRGKNLAINGLSVMRQAHTIAVLTSTMLQYVMFAPT